MNHSFPWLFPDSLKIPWLFPDFFIVFSKFPDFSLTGKSCLIFPGFPGFPVSVGTLYTIIVTLVCVLRLSANSLFILRQFFEKNCSNNQLGAKIPSPPPLSTWKSCIRRWVVLNIMHLFKTTTSLVPSDKNCEHRQNSGENNVHFFNNVSLPLPVSFVITGTKAFPSITFHLGIIGQWPTVLLSTMNSTGAFRSPQMIVIVSKRATFRRHLEIVVIYTIFHIIRTLQ